MMSFDGNQRGWNARISLPKLPIFIYLQMKLFTGNEEELIVNAARMVCNVLYDHCRNSRAVTPLGTEDLKKVHVVLYDWTDEYSYSNIKGRTENGAVVQKRPSLSNSGELILTAAAAYIPQMQVKWGAVSITPDDFLQTVGQYMRGYWSTNYHFVGRKKLEHWVLPSFLTFFYLLNKIEQTDL